MAGIAALIALASFASRVPPKRRSPTSAFHKSQTKRACSSLVSTILCFFIFGVVDFPRVLEHKPLGPPVGCFLRVAKISDDGLGQPQTKLGFFGRRPGRLRIPAFPRRGFGCPGAPNRFEQPPQELFGKRFSCHHGVCLLCRVPFLTRLVLPGWTRFLHPTLSSASICCRSSRARCWIWAGQRVRSSVRRASRAVPQKTRMWSAVVGAGWANEGWAGLGLRSRTFLGFRTDLLLPVFIVG